MIHPENKGSDPSRPAQGATDCVKDTSHNVSEAPLTHDDLPEQDGSEDPGAGLEAIHDSAMTPEKGKLQSGLPAPTAPPPSPSAMEHIDQRRRNASPASPPRGDAPDETKTTTVGVGEGSTVSHIDTQR